MARKAPASFDFFAADWLASPRILEMLPEQEGAYVRLLAVTWETETCCIPATDRFLASASRLGTRWKRLGQAVKDCFVTCPEHPDKLTNEKLWEVRQDRLAYSDRQSESGRRGADRRWKRNDRKPPDDDGNPNGDPNRAANGERMGSPKGRHQVANGESMARHRQPPPPSPGSSSNRPTQEHRVRPSQPDGGAVDGHPDDPDPEGAISLTIEQQRLVNELRELTGETDRAGLYRLVVARLGDHVFRVISELRVAVNDKRSPVENRGKLFTAIARRIAGEIGIVLFRRRAA